MHGVLCHVGEAGHGVRARGAGRSGAAAGLATPGAGEPGSPGPRAARSHGTPSPGPRCPGRQQAATKVAELRQPQACIRKEAKFITAHYGVQQMS